MSNLYHCRLCNIIVGTHSLNFCLEPARCGCYCGEDDGTFPRILHADNSEYPHVIGGLEVRARVERDFRATVTA